MGKPFSVLYTEAANEAQVSTGDSTSMTKIKQTMKREYERLWMKYLWSDIVVIDRTVSVSSGASTALIPKDIGTIIALTERTNESLLTAVSPRVFQLTHLLQNASSLGPWKYTRGGSVGIAAQPSANGVIKIVSDSASDSDAVRVHGQDTAGNDLKESITQNGTSVVSGTKTFKANCIADVVRSALGTGTLTIKDALDNVLDTIAPREYFNKYERINFTAPTDKAYTLYLTGKLRFQNVEYDSDSFKFDIDQALVLFGMAAIFKDRGQNERAADCEFRAERFIGDLVGEKFVQDDVQEDTNPQFFLNSFDIPFLSGRG